MRRVIPLFVALSLGFAPAPVYRARSDHRTDLEKMQGKWVRVSLILNGERHEEAVGSTAPTIKGDTLAFATPSDAWRLTLDPTKNPKRIDQLQAGAGPNRIRFVGIYELKEDRLVICSKMGGEGDRPTSFDPAAKRGIWLAVYERMKP